jgi:hypothetical protein
MRGLNMAEKMKTQRNQRSGQSSLEREQSVYAANQGRWVAEYAGKHVLIKGAEVVGFYESRDEALTAGYSRFGVCPLYVKQVLSSEPVHHIPNILL